GHATERSGNLSLTLSLDLRLFLFGIPKNRFSFAKEKWFFEGKPVLTLADKPRNVRYYSRPVP
ncbi:MAG: hypothetical protein RSD32_03725, partial [Oscillospiraceae bacterium]